MDTGDVIIFVVFGLIIVYLVDKNSKMMKYKKLYDQALKESNRQMALEYGRLYHRYRTGSSSKNSAAAELIIANDMKAAGIN